MTMEEQIKKLKPVLKKIAAGRGQIRGNFYFAKDGKNVHLAATLVRRDPRGKKVVTETKRLCAADDDLKSAKFVYGTVYTESETGKKLIFELHTLKGVGAKGKLQKTQFRVGLKLFAKENQGFGFLKQAIIRDDEGDEAETVEEADLKEIEEDLALTPEEEADLEDIIRDQAALASANAQLGSKLTGLTEEQQVEVETLMADILALAKKSPDQEEELKALRTELAKLLAPGTTFPTEIGSSVPDEIQVFLSAANDAMVKMLKTDLDKATTRINEIYREVDGVKGDVQKLEELAPERLVELLVSEQAIENIVTQLKHIPVAG